jgi:hypothetical protein
MTEIAQITQPIDSTLSAEYHARRKRMDDAMSLRKPDRVPVAPLVAHFYPTTMYGISHRDAMYHLNRTYEAWKKITMEYSWDAALPPFAFLAAEPLELLGMKQIKWPGGGLANDQPFQWVEGEYVRQDEYDEMLADPNGFAIRKLWPRISTVFAPVGGMAQIPPFPFCFVPPPIASPVFWGKWFLHRK